jgi:HD-GYP domain-containing protein (c-di-GMP phosphodiesterase class II)
MTAGQNIIGVLIVIGWPAAPNFGKTMVKYFTTLGSAIGQLIQSIECIDEINNRYNVIKRIVSLRTNLVFATNKKAIYDNILRNIQDFFDAKWCVLRFIDKETGDLVMVGGNEEIEKIAKRVSPKGTLLEKVMQSKTVQFIADTAYCDFKILPYFNKGIRSIAVSPICVNNVIRGTIKVYFPSPHHWQKSEIEYLRMTGEIIGLLIGDIELHESLMKRTQDVIHSLAKALEAKDFYTIGHSNRVAKTSVACGRALGLSEENLTYIEQAALAHDIGKIGIRDSILLKPNTLDKLEWEAVQKHPPNRVRYSQSC